jgi:sterol desaturase/sphingolipid hydroxylase (fatty acid hydroxylase superfamily)
VTEGDFQLVRGAGFGVALAIGLGLERLAPHARLRGEWRVNGGLWAVNLVVIGTVCGACMCTASQWADARGIGLLNVLAAPAWVAIPAAVAFLDLVSYGWHRANHRVGLLWRFHRVHHSDTRFTVSTAMRFHPGELVLSLPVRLLAVTLLGVPVLGVVIFEMLFTMANFLEHGDIDYPGALERRLQRLLVTPALHRRHHGDRVEELGSNFGTILSLWDRVLRTYEDASSADRVRTGLPGQTASLGLRDAFVLPLHLGRDAGGR